MTAPLWIGLALLAVGAAVIFGMRLPPERRLAAVVLAAAAGLAMMRMVALALPVAVFGLGLWRRSAPVTQAPGGGMSEVASAGLRMTLDRDSGEIDGTVLAGGFAGRRLSAMSDPDLRALARTFEADGDDESLALLLAYLDRRGIARDEPAAPSGDAGPAGPMTEAEALALLGLARGASRAEVRAAYARLIRKVHPDTGGSSALAALLNRARDLLDRD